jgi:hypothetical protein
VIAGEVRRIVPRVLERVPPDEPVLLAGDLNAAGTEHPAVRALVDAGLAEDSTADLVLDHIFHRALDVVRSPRALPTAFRDMAVTWQGGTRRVLLSDHDPVEGVYALRADDG